VVISAFVATVMHGCTVRRPTQSRELQMPCDIGMSVPYYFRTYCTWTDERGHRDSALVLYNMIYGNQVMTEGRWSANWREAPPTYQLPTAPFHGRNDTLRIASAFGGMDCDYRYRVALHADTITFDVWSPSDRDCEKTLKTFYVDMVFVGLPRGTYWLAREPTSSFSKGAVAVVE